MQHQTASRNVMAVVVVASLFVFGLTARPSKAAALPARANTTAAASSVASGGSTPAGEEGGYALGRPLTPPSTANPPNSTTTTTPPADSNGGNLAFQLDSTVESAQGTALTDPLPDSGGDYLRVHALGTVALMTSNGKSVWTVTSNMLYADWHLSWEGTVSTVPLPQLAIGTYPADPFVVAGDEPDISADTHPYAVGDLGGVPVVAVAQTVGISLNGGDCFACTWPFSVPGSTLHLGTFVTVLDLETGRVLYWQVDPGVVTQLAIQQELLLIGNETGNPSGAGQIGQWFSTTSLQALAFSSGTNGQLVAHQRWRYDTGAPWARLLALTAVGAEQVALAWSDTPLGLGVPGPPDGHVVLLDTDDGQVAWNQPTAGYPVYAAFDPIRQVLAVVEQTDPTLAVSYTVVGLQPSDGAMSVSMTHKDALPLGLTVTGGPGVGSDFWLVPAAKATLATVEPPYYTPTAGELDGFAPAEATQVWSIAVAATGLDPLEPGALVVQGGNIIVGSWDTALVLPTTSQPYTQENVLQAYALNTGQLRWQESDPTINPLSLSSVDPAGFDAAVPPVVRVVTDNQEAETITAASGQVLDTQALFGDVTAAVAAPPAVGGTSNLIVGNQSGQIDAYAGSSLRGTPRLLWQTQVNGPVVNMVAADLRGNGVEDLVVAASSEVAVVNLDTGEVLYQVPFPEQYVWTVAVGQLGAGPGLAVIVPTTAVTALDGATGRQLWRWQPTTASYFSDAGVVDGTVVTEYANQVSVNGGATTMDEVGLGSNGRPVWQDAQPTSTTREAQLWNGVALGSAIPDAQGVGAAFTWLTTNGEGRVDVRNARTGALDYSDTDADLANHEGFLVNPSVGLVAYGGQGTVTVGPTGGAATDIPADSEAVATSSTGQSVWLTAQAGLSAFPLGTLAATGLASPVASEGTFLPGRLLVANFYGTGEQVVTLPSNYTAYQVVASQFGGLTLPYQVNSQFGVAVVSLSGSAPTTAAVPPQPLVKPAAKPDTVTVTPPSAPGSAIGQPFLQVAVHGYSAAGQPELSSTAPTGYGPATIDAYLGTSASGKGQTVAIVDAYADPNLVSNVNKFSAQYGLPPACSGSTAPPACFQLTVSQPDGTAGSNPDWDLEMSLDVEWIHAIAPQAHIVLVEAHDDTFASLFRAVKDAARLSPDVISLSWGTEEFSEETYYDHFCQLPNSLCVASSGDGGYPGAYPAYNPRVVAVGGTTLELSAAGSVTSERTWADSGGGRSYFEAMPAYQTKVVSDGRRGMPDVSFDADPQTGVAVYDTTPYDGQTGWFQVGGTSVGAPSWSAILAGADQLRQSNDASRLTASAWQAQRALYGLPAGPITAVPTGPANGGCPVVCQPATGYDDITGLGSPRADIEHALADSLPS